jgi:hypothetical protein
VDGVIVDVDLVVEEVGVGAVLRMPDEAAAPVRQDQDLHPSFLIFLVNLKTTM